MALWIFDPQNNPVRPARQVEKLPNGDYLSPPVAGYVHGPSGYSIQEYTPPAPPAPPELTPEQQAQADKATITAEEDLFVAISRATVRLVKFAVSNPSVVQGATEEQVFQRFEDEVLSVLRDLKGATPQ